MRSLTELLGPNPYWTIEANRLAELNPEGLRPIDLARQLADHRLEHDEPPRPLRLIT